MRGLLYFHKNEISFLNRTLDCLLITVLFKVIVVIPEFLNSYFIISPYILIFLVSFFFLSKAKLYKSFRSEKIFIVFYTVFLGWFNYNLCLLLISFIFKFSIYFSRIEISLWAFTSLFTLIINNIIFRLILRNYRVKGRNTRRILYWGSSEELKKFMNQVKINPWMGYKVVAWFYHMKQNNDLSLDDSIIYGGSLIEMKNWLTNNSVDRIIFTDSSELKISKSLINLFGDTSIPITYQPSWANNTMRFELNSIGEYMSVDIWSGQKDNSSLKYQKRIFDLTLASIFLLVSSPFLFVIYILIKMTSKGPAIFSQYRYGLNGKKFKIFKFRTMIFEDSNNIKEIKQAEKNDARVTIIGKFLRKYSIDELPQLINVLRNEMSLVGPRPHAIQHNEMYRKLILGYMQRHSFPPGMTGLAQINGFRGEIKKLSDMQRRTDHDLIYQKQWSVFLDFKIILTTILKIKSPKAY